MICLDCISSCHVDGATESAFGIEKHKANRCDQLNTSCAQLLLQNFADATCAIAII